MSLTFCWRLTKSANIDTSASLCIVCNGTCIRGCFIGGSFARNCNGTFTSFIYNNDDNIRVCTIATDFSGEPNYASASICLCAITLDVGDYYISTPSNAISEAGVI